MNEFFLLGQYCSSDDEEIIEEGVNNISTMKPLKKTMFLCLKLAAVS